MQKPELDDLWTAAHIARRLGISRQGAQQLIESREDFPDEIGRVGNYRIWWRPEVEEWVVEHREKAVTKSEGRLPCEASSSRST